MRTPAPAPRPSLQKAFIAGVLTLLPIWLTWVVVKFVFVLLSDTSRPLVDPVLRSLAATNPQTLGWLLQPWVQTALALLATLGVILLSGVMARRVFGQRLLRWFEALIARIPLASTIYGSARKLLDILQTSPDGTQRVVLVDFPHTEMKSVGFILLAGWLARRVVGQRLLRWFEALVARIPLASTIYGSARKLLDILQTKPDGTQRVVLIDFPHNEMKTLGFVTRVMREIGTGRELAAVYVPTTPNPTSGYLEIVPMEKITPTDWTVDQAMSFIISGGAVAPDTIPFAPPAAKTP